MTPPSAPIMLPDDLRQALVATGLVAGVSTHAQERMAERFGCVPNAEEWHRVVDDIRLGRARHLGTGGQDELFGVHIGRHAVRVWWNAASAKIVTVLRPDQAPTRDFVPAEKGMHR